MLQNIKDLYGNKILASDGVIGHVQDFYFDDIIWVIRYMVADTGNWLPGREVLLSPHSFGPLNQEEETMLVNLTKKQIEDSPMMETHEPVSRQYEMEYYRYYGWPAYWNGGSVWGFNNYPVVMPPSRDQIVSYDLHHSNDDKHLQSMSAVDGYHIQATDGMIGHVSDFLIDDMSWSIRELVVETGHWYSGKEILISPDKIDRISYEESKVFVNLSKADIQRTEENEIAQKGTVSV